MKKVLVLLLVFGLFGCDVISVTICEPAMDIMGNVLEVYENGETISLLVDSNGDGVTGILVVMGEDVSYYEGNNKECDNFSNLNVSREFEVGNRVGIVSDWNGRQGTPEAYVAVAVYMNETDTGSFEKRSLKVSGEVTHTVNLGIAIKYEDAPSGYLLLAFGTELWNSDDIMDITTIGNIIEAEIVEVNKTGDTYWAKAIDFNVVEFKDPKGIVVNTAALFLEESMYVYAMTPDGCIEIEIKSNEQMKILHSSWNQLSLEMQNEIIGTWNNGSVENFILEESSFYSIKNNNLIGESVYLITFKSIRQPFIGNVRIIVDKDSLDIVGQYYRE